MIAPVKNVYLNIEELPAIHSPEAERSVLGAMLADPEIIDLAEESLIADDFFQPAHQTLFKILSEMRAEGKPIDPTTLLLYLEDKKLDKAVGGAQLLGELSCAVVSAMTAPAFIEIVRDKSILRHLSSAVNHILYDIHYSDNNVNKITDNAETEVFNVTNNRPREYQLTDAKGGIYQAIDEMEATAKRGDGLNGPSTGMPTLDRDLCGWEPNMFTIIGARPNVGKTNLALSFIRHLSKNGVPSCFISLESKVRKLNKRLLAMESGVALTKINQAKLTDLEYDKIAQATDTIAQWPHYMVDAAGVTISNVRSLCRRAIKRGCKVVFIDYLQLISAPGAESRVNEVSAVSRGLQQIARQFPISIVVLAQLNRDSVREEREPRLSDLKESGQIEQDADVVMFIHREKRDDGLYSWENGKLICAKGRDVQIGYVPLSINHLTAEFTEGKPKEFDAERERKSWMDKWDKN